jgi:ribonuclease H2 subunit C
VAAAILPPSKDAAAVVEDEVIDLEDPNRGKPAQGHLDVQAEFDEVVVWGHEVAVGADGGYVRGMEEWVALAGEIHSYPNPKGSGK